MGLMDAIDREETVAVKISKYTELVRGATRTGLIAKAVERGVPMEYIQLIFFDDTADYVKDMSDLKAYRASGITPKNMKVIDEEYRKLSKHNAELMESVAELTKYSTGCNEEIGKLRSRIRELEASVASQATRATRSVIEIHVPGDDNTQI